jgi:hypothetical protein
MNSAVSMKNLCDFGKLLENPSEILGSTHPKDHKIPGKSMENPRFHLP